MTEMKVSLYLSAGGPRLKTSPHLSGSIKSLHFFQTWKKKPDLAQLRVNPEQSVVIWALNKETETVWNSVVSQCERTVAALFLDHSEGFVEEVLILYLNRKTTVSK